MPLIKVLLSDFDLAANAKQRLFPNIPVSGYDRIHIHIGAKRIDGINTRVLFGSVISTGLLLSDSTVWYGESATTLDFDHTERALLVPASS